MLVRIPKSCQICCHLGRGAAARLVGSRRGFERLPEKGQSQRAGWG